MGGFRSRRNNESEKEKQKIYFQSISVKPADLIEIGAQEEFEFETEIPKVSEQFRGLNDDTLDFEDDDYESIFNKLFKKKLEGDQDQEEAKKKESSRISMRSHAFDDDKDDFYLGGKQKLM